MSEDQPDYEELAPSKEYLLHHEKAGGGSL